MLKERKLPKMQALMTCSATALMLALTMSSASTAFAQNSSDSSNNGSNASAPEIVVTGSRIQRRDLQSNSPLVTINSQAFEDTANVAVEATLNKLPQFVAGQNGIGANAADIQGSATHTVGISVANLRGLNGGASRTLVLVDGRRMTPVNGQMQVDLNAIPSAAIDHVETITGGASAVYGADAVAGVVNFVLKKNFKGIDIDAQYGEAEVGDDQEFKVDMLAGTTFDDDRGNVMVGVEHYDRGLTPQSNRDFYTDSWKDPTVGGTNFTTITPGWYYTVAAPAGGIAAQYQPTLNAFKTVFAGSTPNTSLSGVNDVNSTAMMYHFNSDGTIWFSGAAQNAGCQSTQALYKGPLDNSEWALVNVYDVRYAATHGGVSSAAPPPVCQTVKANLTNQFLYAPMERWSAFGSAHYDITDNLSAFFNFNFEKYTTNTLSYASNLLAQYSAEIPYDGVNGANAVDANGKPDPHPVPAQLAALLNSRTAAAGPWDLNYWSDTGAAALVGNRTNAVTQNEFELLAGLDGKLPFRDWTWELYGSHGESSNYVDAPDVVSRQRYWAIINAPNWGQNFKASGSQGFGSSSPGALSGTVTCTSGFYNTVFFGQAPTPDCISAITADLQQYTEISQNVVEFDTQGGIIDLPAGELRGSLGASYRDDTLLYRPDDLQTANDFIEQNVGPPFGFSTGSISAREGYGELLVPVLKDLPGIKQFDLELGARYSTYTNSPAGWTYKILGDWSVTNWLRIRGGYNLAVRAPSVGESYLALTQSFSAGGSTGDPCSLASGQYFGAGHADDAVLATGTQALKTSTLYNTSNANAQLGAESTFALCRALMGDVLASGADPLPAGFGGGTGPAFAGAAATYYGSTNVGQFPKGAGAPGFTYQQGTPTLGPEKANTWTAGMVVQSPFKNVWLQRTSLTVDWYNIIINHTINLDSVDDSNALCFARHQVVDSSGKIDGGALSAALADPACNIFSQRDQTTGLATSGYTFYTNLGYQQTDGIDAQFNWGADFADLGLAAIPGSVNVNVLANYLLHWRVNGDVSNPASYLIDYAGSDGTFTAPRYRINTSLSYIVGPATVTLAWRHTPTMDPTAIKTYKAALAAIAGGNTHVATPDPNIAALDIAEHDEFDLSATYNFTKNVTLRAGVENLTNASPEATAATRALYDSTTASWTLPSSGLGTTDAALFDVLGRRYYAGINFKF